MVKAVNFAPMSITQVQALCPKTLRFRIDKLPVRLTAGIQIEL
jgi:hypothetical protein